jgi:hypothetical protein
MAADQVRLLIIQANPPGAALLNTDVDERELQHALQRGRRRDAFALLPRVPAARVRDVQEALHTHQPHILHFLGPGDGAGGLLLNAPYAGG